MGSKLWGFAALIGGLALTVISGGVAAGWWTAAAMSTASAWIAGATVVSSLVAGNIAARDARRAANASLQDRVTTIRSTDEPRAVLFGMQRVGGVLTYVSPPFGPKKESVTLVITLVGHPCDGFESIWINDEPVTLDAGGFVIGGPSGKWQSRTSDISSGDYLLGPDVWNASTPSLNRIAAPDGALGVVSVMYESAPGEPYTLATPDVDYVVIPNSFDVGLLNPAMTNRSVIVTYNKRVALRGSIQIRTWTGYETGNDRRDTDLETNSGGAWTATSTGDGICRMAVTLTYDETMFADGLPSFSAVVRGARVYDPRKDSTNGGSGSHRYTDPTTWEWTRNPALAARHYLTHEWGLGIAHSRIDDATVIAAANACEAQITLREGYTESQFSVDGFLSTSQSPLDNLDEICAAMGGFAAPSGSKWRIVAGAWTAPAADAVLRDEHVVEDAEITVYQDAGELFNSVRGRYRDSQWQITDFPSYSSPTYVSQDNGETIWRDVDLPLTLDPIRAQRVAKLTLFRARQSLVYSATFSIAAWRFQAGDRLRLLLTEYGWDTVSQDSGTGKVFRVIDRQWVFPDRVRLSLIEDTAAVYAWNYSEAAVPDPTPNSTLPSASVVQAPTNLAGSATTTDFVVMPDGTRVGFVKLTWDAITDSGVLAGGWIEIRWKRAQEPADALRIVRVSPYSVEYRIEGIREDEYLNIGIAAVNASQARSSTTLVNGIGGLPNGLFGVEAGFVVSGGGSVVSGNLLVNAAFEFDLDSWTEIAEPGIASAYTIEKPTGSDKLEGPPAWNVVMYEGSQGVTSPTGGALYLTPAAALSVEPGERYGASARFVLDGADAIVHLQWQDENRAVIAGGPYGSTITQATAGNPTQLDTYTTHAEGVVYGTAPANARFCRPFYIKLGTKAGKTASAAYITRPMFYEIGGADTVPKWEPGSEGPVTTTRITPFAATAVYRQAYGVTSVPSIGNDVHSRLLVNNYTLTISESGWVVVSLEAGATWTAKSGTSASSPSVGTLVLYTYGHRPALGETFANAYLKDDASVSSTRYFGQAIAEGSFSGSVVAQQEFEATAGEVLTIRADVVFNPATAAQINFGSLRIEHIKR